MSESHARTRMAIQMDKNGIKSIGRRTRIKCQQVVYASPGIRIRCGLMARYSTKKGPCCSKHAWEQANG